MICSTCGNQKSEVQPKKSRIAPSVTLFKCQQCIDRKMEPRYLIIIYGRQNGFETVAEFIKIRRYVGDEILANELV